MGLITFVKICLETNKKPIKVVVLIFFVLQTPTRAVGNQGGNRIPPPSDFGKNRSKTCAIVRPSITACTPPPSRFSNIPTALPSQIEERKKKLILQIATKNYLCISVATKY